MAKVIVECNRCGKEFSKYPSQVGKNNYCSRKCISNKVKTECKHCYKEYEIKRYLYKGNRMTYCSRECKDNFQKTLVGSKNHFYGKRHTEETKLKISSSKRGVELGKRVEWVEVSCAYCGKHKEVIPYLSMRNEKHFCDITCHAKWRSENLVGDKNDNYNHNLTVSERIIGRRYKEYYEFIREVLATSDSCEVCKSKEKLCVHHKDAYHWCVERRVDITNGVVLCKSCHREFHKQYSYRNNTEEQYIQFLNNKLIPS